MTPDRNVLALQCPYCGHEHTDDYECLDIGQPDALVCEGEACGQQFSFLIRECLECGEESVFIWKSMPAPETLALLSCIRCGAPFDESAPEGQSPNPAQRI
jgi:transcription elongation factor Elf1